MSSEIALVRPQFASEAVTAAGEPVQGEIAPVLAWMVLGCVLGEPAEDTWALGVQVLVMNQR